MPTPLARFLLILLLFPLISLGQSIRQKSSLTGRTFQIVMGGEGRQKKTAIHLFFLFRANQVAVFRVKSNHQVLDHTMQWHMEGDSLWLQVKPASLGVGGTIDAIELTPTTYALIQTVEGYVLRRKDEQLRLVEQK